MKYVIITSLELPIVFPDVLEHRDWIGNNLVVSAGFCDISVESRAWQEGGFIEVEVWGRSISLDVHSRPEDAGLILRMIRSY